MNIEISEDALIDANKLKNNSIQKRQIKENVVEIVRKINEDLKDAHREGKHCLITEIPITFDIPNMSNKDAQRSIWSSILSFFKQKHYRIWINYDENSCRLKITWFSDDDELTFKTQLRVIKESKLNNL